MQNKLKPVTNEIIKDLNDCEIRTIMATGDNMLTAISVAKQCNIIPDNEDVFLADVKDYNGVDRIFWRITSG